MSNKFIEIYFHFDAAQFARIMKALNRLESVAEELEDSLPRRNAVDYSNLLRGNINGQKHMSGYTPYSAMPSAPRYEDWKAQYALYSGYWRAMGSLINAITFWKEEKGVWKSGIPAGVYDSGGTSWLGAGDLGPPKPIAMYARVIEYGEYTHPERPIFRPTLKEYKENQFLDRGEEAQNKLGKQWR